MWGHETNLHGARFEDFIQDYALQIHNAGRDFTFECKTGKSGIDVTLSRNLKLKIEDWKVCKAYNHYAIKFNITTDIIEVKPRRLYDSADWNLFKTGLQKQHLRTYTKSHYTVKNWSLWSIK